MENAYIFGCKRFASFEHAYLFCIAAIANRKESISANFKPSICSLFSSFLVGFCLVLKQPGFFFWFFYFQSDIRKWFMKQHAKNKANEPTPAKAATPANPPPAVKKESEKVVSMQ